MEVILLKDVKKQGKVGDIIKVSDGYAKNFLIAKGLAEPAVKQNLLQLQKTKSLKIKQDQELLKKSEILKEKLEEIVLNFKLKVNKGKVFGAVTSKQIIEKLDNEYNIFIDKRKIIDYKPLNQLIESTVKIKLLNDLIANLKIKIEKE